MNDELLRHFFGGFVRLHILYHADKEAICGVEMIDELKRHGYRLGPGTIYPILHDLEESGYLTSENVVHAGKRRKNYRITASGRKLLVNARTKLRELVSEVIDDRDRMSEARRTSRTRRTAGRTAGKRSGKKTSPKKPA